MIPAAFKKNTKVHQDHSNRPTDFSSKTKTIFMQNGGRLEKKALFWILKWLQNCMSQLNSQVHSHIPYTFYWRAVFNNYNNDEAVRLAKW